ncbi:MAG TPA: tetratricopeptide repeat protein [Bryobacteraceae bacterium]|jgi:tetratricopeptide (TPR) repeat protein
MMTKQRVAMAIGILFALNLAIVVGFEAPTIFYMGNVIMHLFLGLAVVGLLLAYKQPSLVRWLGVGSLASGVAIIAFGNITANRPLLWAHIALSLIGAAIVLTELWRAMPVWRMAMGTGLAIVIGVPVIAMAATRMFPKYASTVRNPTMNIPVSMQGEGGGPKSPFWPSSSKTNIGGIIPSNFFMDSARCGECHKEIYEQWNSSAHHFASFNNQYYRKSIEYMQDVSGTQGSKWCAGCHDHAVFFNGRFDRPIKEQIDTPEAQNGLGCMSCHSIVHVDSTMGNAGFTVEYPPLHELASSKNRFIKGFDDFLTYLQPGPHKQVFMKPFMRNSSEFCSACHKVHLDVPVNNYRWMRGFNDYDNWQASGVSGQGARSFYYPPASQTCSACHMPMVASHDPAAKGGVAHSHRFPAANTALPTVNEDAEQLKTVEAFLKSGFISVDIFAASPVQETGGEMRRRAAEGPNLSSTMAVGEEAEQGGGPVLIREVGEVAAPVDQAGAKFKPGSTVRLDVVVRTRKIGHFFPGGTVDSNEVWLELQGKDAAGRIVYWSGFTENDGRVEKGAHVYKSYQLDANGNAINKRNAFQARSLLYVRLIPPGAADTAHFRVKIPENAQGPLTFTAKLNYRKFSHFYNEYAYAGQPKPGQDPKLVGLDHEDREWSYDPTNIPKNVSGKIKDRIPELPIVTLAESKAVLAIGDNGGPLKPVVRKQDRERWNDWGIGLLLQGDLKGAEYAFKRVTEAEPGYADGWLNVGRALIQEGEVEAAKPYVAKALQINYSLGRAHFFEAMIHKADGDYDGALENLKMVTAEYPRDRVVLNQIGRILFLERKYGEAIDALDRVLTVDPEDLQAHYSLMLAYRGAGDVDKALREEALFRRFKADEASQSITAKARMLSVEDNNERQTIHEHENGYRPAATFAGGN